LKNRFNALIANTNGLCLMEQEGQMPVHNAAVQICIDRKKTAVRPDAAVQVVAGAKAAAGGKFYENMSAN
jgi:hypothetical protein